MKQGRYPIAVSNHVLAILDHLEEIERCADAPADRVKDLKEELGEILVEIELRIAEGLNLMFGVDTKVGDISETIAKRHRSLHMDVPLVSKCARCGMDHENVRFKRMELPVGANTHWAMCPSTGDPIMLSLQ